MKECRYCGTKYNNVLDSCPNCGGTVIVTEQEARFEQEQQRAERQVRSTHKKHVRAIVIAGVAVVAVIITIVAVSGNPVERNIASHDRGVVSGDNDTSLDEGVFRDDTEDIQAAYQKTYELGVAYFESGSYENAISAFESIGADYENYADAQAKLNEATAAYKVSVISQADEYWAGGDFESAQRALQSIVSVLGEDIEITVKLSNITDEYKSLVMKEAEEAFNTHGYQKAMDVLLKGMSALPGDTELSALMEDYRTYEPIDLFTINAILGGQDYKKISSEEDNYGNNYTSGYMVQCSNASSTISKSTTYNLGGEYSKIYGTLALPFKQKDTPLKFWVEVYDQERLIGKSDILQAGSKPVSFSFNISGVNDLKIAFLQDRSLPQNPPIIVPEISIAR